jgi:cytochrome P450
LIYDPYARAFQEDPYPLYRHFRDHEPCAYNAKMDFYALFRFEDVWQATLDWETYSSSYGPTLENRGQVPGELMSIIGMDPPRHVRVRNLVSKGFTPRRIAALEVEVRRLTKRYLDPVSGRGKDFDFQAALSNKLPMDVISALLGIPEEERDGYRAAVERGLERDPETGAIPPDGIEGMQRARELLVRLLAARRRKPENDLITLLALTEYEDVDGKSKLLREDEAVSFLGLLAAAGAETTTKLLGNCMVYLGRNPEQRARLWADPALLPQAIEEVLRYDAPSQFQGRVALKEVTVHGVTIPRLARVALVTGAACRDEREFRDAERFDISRKPERQLYFGYGNHVCIGKSLARLEAKVVLEEVRERFPDYAIDESGLTRTFQAHVRGFKTVTIAT